MDLLELMELRPVLGDGAMGTALMEQGLKIGGCPEAWNLERPEVVAGIHKAYRDAGCDFVETNTFGANTIKLARHGLDSKLADLVRTGVELARQAAGDACLVAGSVGPTGVLLEPYGDVSADRVRSAFSAQVKELEAAGVDFFLIETMTDLNEAQLAVEAVREVSRRPVGVTMVFSKGAQGYRTVMGTSPQEAAQRLAEAGVDLIGTNCCNGMAEALEIMAEMVPVTDLFTLAQPNAGLPQAYGDRVVYPETPKAMADLVEDLLGMGVRGVGGCCGTTPEHIRQMAIFMGKTDHADRLH
jgi:5-methyltetrahydrofolate--homocysteine methyltransferase